MKTFWHKVDMQLLASYMDDDIRERVHFELAPCMPWEFLDRYLQLDPSFEVVLKEVGLL